MSPSSRVAKVEVELDSSLSAEMVRFLWKQENFENAFEFWALDDVRVRKAQRGTYQRGGDEGRILLCLQCFRVVELLFFSYRNRIYNSIT